MPKCNQDIADDLEKIRLEGKWNMLDFHGVHREANDNDMYELVLWMHDLGLRGWGEVIFKGPEVVSDEEWDKIQDAKKAITEIY